MRPVTVRPTWLSRCAAGHRLTDVAGLVVEEHLPAPNDATSPTSTRSPRAGAETLKQGGYPPMQGNAREQWTCGWGWGLSLRVGTLSSFRPYAVRHDRRVGSAAFALAAGVAESRPPTRGCTPPGRRTVLVTAQPALGLLAAAPRAAPRHDTARAWSSRRRAACRAAKSMPRGSLRGGGDAAGLAYRALERCVARGVQPAAPMAPGVAEPRAAPRTRWRCGLHAGRRSAVNFSALDTRYRSDVTRGV